MNVAVVLEVGQDVFRFYLHWVLFGNVEFIIINSRALVDFIIFLKD